MNARTQRKLAAFNFRRAAARVARSTLKDQFTSGSMCAALPANDFGYRLVHPLREVYGRDARRVRESLYWGYNFGVEDGSDGCPAIDARRAREGRVLALCFMAAMAEAGDLDEFICQPL